MQTLNIIEQENTQGGYCDPKYQPLCTNDCILFGPVTQLQDFYLSITVTGFPPTVDVDTNYSLACPR